MQKSITEIFTGVEFDMPLLAVQTKESNYKTARLKIIVSYANNIIFKVDFTTTHIKMKMQRKMNFLKSQIKGILGQGILEKWQGSNFVGTIVFSLY